MRRTSIALALAILAGSSSAFAATHSDMSKGYQLRELRTFEFKPQNRISRDPLANNDIWANDVRQAIRNDLASHGLIEATNGNPDFYVAFYVGLRNGYDLESVGYGVPRYYRGFATRWWGFRGGYDLWAVPYTESTLIIDVIDAHDNQLVWRGYDTDTLNLNKPYKSFDKAVDKVLSRFYHDAREAHDHLG